MARAEYFEIVAKSALNRVQHMGFDWSLNPYQGCFHSCVYCFARAHARLADRDPGAGFSSRVGIKVNVAGLLRRELASPRWKQEKVAFGTATDPYQPIEGSTRLSRRCLEAFRDYRTPVGLITKGTMVIRDIDVLVELSRRASTTVCFSVPTVDETVWANIVYLKPGTKEHFLEFLGREYPHLLPRYRVADYRQFKAQPPPPPVQLGLLG